MSERAARPGRLARLFGWIVRTLSGSRTRSAAPVVPLLPGVFLSRAPFAVASRTVASAPALRMPTVPDRAFGARLRSVSVQNVPTALKGPRRKVPGPAGKPIPKRAPRVLKRYKPSGGALIAAARAHAARLSPLWPSNVVDLADVVRRRLAGTAMPAQTRAA